MCTLNRYVYIRRKMKKKCIASIILYSRTSSTWFHLRISIFESFKNIFTRHKNLHRFCICWAYNFLFSSEGIYGWINTNYSMFFISLLRANKIWFSLLNWKTITSYTEIVTQKVNLVPYFLLILLKQNIHGYCKSTFLVKISV